MTWSPTKTWWRKCQKQARSFAHFLVVSKRSHEAACGHQPVKCKYATYGCDWTGLRKDLASHENCDCPYGRISKLVDEVRTLKASHEQQIGRMQMSISRLSHQVASHRANGAGGGGGYGMFSSEDPGSLLACLKFASLCISSPSQIATNKFQWNKFACASFQARLVNTATCLLYTSPSPRDRSVSRMPSSA